METKDQDTLIEQSICKSIKSYKKFPRKYFADFLYKQIMIARDHPVQTGDYYVAVGRYDI